MKQLFPSIAAIALSGIAAYVCANMKKPNSLVMLNVEALSIQESNIYTKYKAKNVYTYMKYRQEYNSETGQYEQVPDGLWTKTDCIGFMEGVVECYAGECPALTDEIGESEK